MPPSTVLVAAAARSSHSQRRAQLIRQLARGVLAAGGAVLMARLAWLWQKLRREPTAAVYYCASAAKVASIVESRASLRSPSYVPPLWATSTWLNLLAFMVKQKLYSKFSLRREVCEMEDGGTVSIDWADDPATQSLPPDAPIVVFLHTITGSGKTTVDFLQFAASQGWRGCVFNRRGHDQKLTTARFNMMGSARDTSLQMDAVMRSWPKSRFMGMVGISAGSGLLITYLGSEAEHCRVDAAASLCPAYSIDTAFTTLADVFPVVDRSMLSNMKDLWLKEMPQLLEEERRALERQGQVDASAVTAQREKALVECRQARSVHEFMYSCFPFARQEKGQETLELRSSEEFFNFHNPVKWRDDVLVPTMLLNAEDDIVCRRENIPSDLVDAPTSPTAALVITKYGSHIAFQESLFGNESYMHRITFEFFEAALEQKEKALRGSREGDKSVTPPAA